MFIMRTRLDELGDGDVRQLAERRHLAATELDGGSDLFVGPLALPSRVGEVRRLDHRPARSVATAELAVARRAVLLPSYDGDVFEPGRGRRDPLRSDRPEPDCYQDSRCESWSPGRHSRKSEGRSLHANAENNTSGNTARQSPRDLGALT